MPSQISDIRAREIIDCRGFPTVEVDVWVNGELAGRAAVPAGRSTGKREAVELRDGGPRWGGMGTQKAVGHVNDILRPRLLGIDPRGVARAGARVAGLPLFKYLNPEAHVIPVPLVNLINGGKLTSNDLEIQEFLVIPVGARGLLEGLQICYEINFILHDLIVEKYGKIAANVGDEGGFAPPMTGIREPMRMLSAAVEASGHADKILYGLDAAASHWYDWEKGVYRMEGEEMTRDDVIALYVTLCEDYPIGSIEDPLMEDDLEGYTLLTRKLDGVQIVGDDLFTTNIKHIRRGVEAGAANAVLWKFNQVGTLTEAFDAADYAYGAGFGVQVSERSGETEDTSIADLAVALNCGQIKTGTTRSERTAKYNQLLRIAEELGDRAHYPGPKFRRPV
jgi:enolase